MKPITQSRWIHGLNATFGIFSQPDGTVPRLSNMLLTKRGSLVTCGGSQLLASAGFAGVDPTIGNTPMWLDLFLYQVQGGGPINQSATGTRQMFGLLHSPIAAGAPNQVTLVALPVSNPGFPNFDPWSSVSLVANFGQIIGLIAVDSSLGGYGGGGGGLDQGFFKTALEFCAVPQMLQFTGKMILCLGSGTAPYVSDGTSAGTTAILTNSFSAQYPVWQANVSWPQGSMIQVFVGTAYYVFKAVQGGISGTVTPVFTQVQNSTVADGSVIWQNGGQVTTSPVPRGAAHGINYAGSLWLANTAPSYTADGLDGPSALRMSDINDYNSWNPLNAAQLDRDDGTEITGLASFTIAEVGISPTGSLLVFKQFSTFQVIGVFGATSLTIQPLQTDLGCIAPRSIQFLPSFGIMRLSHLGFAITNGVVDKLVCEEIRPYLFPGTFYGSSFEDADISTLDWNFAWFSKAAQTANPPMYVCACPIPEPLVGAAMLQSLSGVSAISVPAPTAFTGQTWYVKVSMFGPCLYEYAASAEFGPFVLNSAQGVQVAIPGVTAGAIAHVYLYQKSTSGLPISGYYVPLSVTSVPATIVIVDLTGFYPGNPPSASIPGALTRLFCFDLILKAWAVVDLPWPISVLKQFRMHGSIPITVCGGFNDGTVRRVLTTDLDWDGQPIRWAVQGREVFGEGGSQELFMRRLIVRGYGQDAAQHMVIVPTYDGNDDYPGHSVGETVQVTGLGGDQFEVRLDLQRIARNVHVQLTGQGIVEITALEYEVEPCEVGAPIVIA